MNPSPETVAHLEFTDLAFSVALEGLVPDLIRPLTSSWFAKLASPARRSASYRVQFCVDPQIPFHYTSSRALAQSMSVRHRRRGDEDELRTPGARIRIRPGRPRARVSIHPAVLERPALLELAAGAALSHGLALHGAAILHGSAFQLHDRSILGLGSTGSGKSTLAAAAIANGGRVASDDSLILGRSRSSSVILRPLRRDLYFRQGTLEVLPTSLRDRCRESSDPLERRWALARSLLKDTGIPTLSPNEIWRLQLDRRFHRCRRSRANQALGLATLIRHASPLYLSQRFEKERSLLLALFETQVALAPSYEAILGTDLLCDPAQATKRLLSDQTGRDSPALLPGAPSRTLVDRGGRLIDG